MPIWRVGVNTYVQRYSHPGSGSVTGGGAVNSAGFGSATQGQQWGPEGPIPRVVQTRLSYINSDLTPPVPDVLAPPDDYWVVFAAAQITRKWYMED